MIYDGNPSHSSFNADSLHEYTDFCFCFGNKLDRINVLVGGYVLSGVSPKLGKGNVEREAMHLSALFT